MSEVVAYIGLGSNLEDPQAQVCTALDELQALPRTELDLASSLYRSAPMGPQDQPDYINAVARLRTALEARELLLALQAVERAHGRTRARHWGPRTLDLDILLYGELEIDSEDLHLPHPGIAERNFVLYPLAEIEPWLNIPGQGSLPDLLNNCSTQGLQRLEAAICRQA